MRTIDKVGGLDEYLLGEKSGRVRELGMGGWALRWRLMRTEKVRERFRLQRVAMGLPEGGYEDVMKLDGGVVSEGEAADRERAIDIILDKEAKREDAGVELGNLEAAQMGEVKKESPRATL